MSGPDLLLAVDGGGTKTRVLVTDLDGNVLGRGLGPGSNHHTVGFDRFGAALTGAIEQALRAAEAGRPSASADARDQRQVAAACFGLSGIDSEADEVLVSDWVREREIAPAFVVLNDCELILAAGTPEGWGVALISGTGSICLGRSPDGRTARAGGWGTLLGDEGSAYCVAVRALREAARTYDGRSHADALLQAALAHWQVADVPSLMNRLGEQGTTSGDIARLAPAVFELASRGDVSACSIVDDAAADLAAHVRTVAHRLDMRRPPLALAGGVLSGRMRPVLTSMLAEEVGPVTFVDEPVRGGVTLARRLLSTARPS